MEKDKEIQQAERVNLHLRGSNLSGVRAHNERLILSLVRQKGTMTKAEISRNSGLSAQTASVITRQLEADGLLQRHTPIRGRVGQPSTPLSIAADGAYFAGLKIGRRSLDLVIVDFLGNPVARRRRLHSYPTPAKVIDFIATELPDAVNEMAAASRPKLQGLGIAMPFELWNWMPADEAPPEEMIAWKDCDIAAELGATTGLPVSVRNDATAACEAELVFGKSDRPRDFLYLYFGYFIGGGLVLDGRLFAGPTGNAAGVGPMPVIGPDRRMTRLMKVASLSTLENALKEAGIDTDQLWRDPSRWNLPDSLLSQWIDGCAGAIASATLSAATILELDAVFIDGWIPEDIRARLVEAAQTRLQSLDLAGIAAPRYLPGSIGADARSLGGAATALSTRYLVDQNALFT
ncbi:ROK family transcriptional regulator [Actibacterium mucosum KCTC 23349]|uniref:ROK family transcriptional regulator n=1 Tax=Actibacterium mucosum KCTC 23349 TaxID=1454373 RepID=A0A037ZKS8_9RHOB|nr:ROK family transcriptional regulator [Actibacterium mucosum KCTC 23349]